MEYIYTSKGRDKRPRYRYQQEWSVTPYNEHTEMTQSDIKGTLTPHTQEDIEIPSVDYKLIIRTSYLFSTEYITLNQ